MWEFTSVRSLINNFTEDSNLIGHRHLQIYPNEVFTCTLAPRSEQILNKTVKHTKDLGILNNFAQGSNLIGHHHPEMEPNEIFTCTLVPRSEQILNQIVHHTKDLGL